MIDLFEERWNTYRTVIDNDWMHHRDVTETCAGALSSWIHEHPDRRGRARLLDLGCGDIGQMAPVFGGLPLDTYVGVDLTEPVLPMAREALGDVPFRVEFHNSDVRGFVEATGDTFDLVHAAFVLHHLTDDEKVQFLPALRLRIRPGGAFLWTDVFREPGESRPDYLARYTARIRQDWNAIDTDAREAIVTHVNAYDFPADRGSITLTAARAGWNLRWLWRGPRQAEAVALLTPA